MNVPKIQKKWLGYIAVLIVLLNLTSLYNSRHFDQALKINELGENLETNGDIQGAIKKYEEAVRIYSKSAYLLASLGKAYHKINNDEKALQTYEKALQRSPQHFWVHYLIGQLYRDEQRYHEAVEKFNQLINMKDNRYFSNKLFQYTQYQNLAYGELGYCYSKLGQWQKARAAYEQYLLLNPSAQDRKSVENYLQLLKKETSTNQ